MGNPCAVVGIGQTQYATSRELSIAGLCREAAEAALRDADLTWRDIDAVVIGKAPDMFEGVLMPELYLADALGAVGKPMMRIHTAGSVGGSTCVAAAHFIHSGGYDRVLALGFEKQSDGNAMWVLSPNQPFSPKMARGAGGAFAPYIRGYIRRSGAPDYIGMLVAVKDRLNGCKNPYAHLKMPDITLDKVADSPMLWNPVRFLETCPSSDGACAMVLASEGAAAKSPNPPAWVLGTATRSEPAAFPGRDAINPRGGSDCAQQVYREAGITDPAREIDTAELYVPFSWFEPMWLENLGLAPIGEGWKLVEDGSTAIGGALPINPSGGVLCSNPVGASGTCRFAEAALQVRGQAGDHQVDGARVAFGHAFGGLCQYFAMWAVGAAKP